MIRAFVGIALPAEVSNRLAAIVAGLPVGRAVEAANLHVTLAFLGEQPVPVLEDLHLGLGGIAAAPFPLSIGGLGIFGGDRPRTLHAEVAPNPALARLRARVQAEARSVGIGIPRERFVPHVTLARFRRPPEGEELARLQAFVGRRLGLGPARFDVAHFVLFRSELHPAGSSYEALARYPLAG